MTPPAPVARPPEPATPGAAARPLTGRRIGGAPAQILVLCCAALHAASASAQSPTAEAESASEPTAPHDEPPGLENASNAGPADATTDEPEPPESYRDPPPPPGARYPLARDPATASVRTQEGALRIPAAISARLRVLALDLDALAARGGSSVASGVLSVVTGGLAVTLGLLFEDDSVATFFYVFGGASAARGIFDLALSPDPQTPALEYAHMPMRSPAEVRSRLRLGEQGLEELASRTHISRIVDGTLSIAAGVLIVPLALAPDGFAFDDALEYFVVIGASISVLSGVISLLSESSAERRWRAYRVLRAKLRRKPRRARSPAGNVPPPAPAPTPSLGAAPLPGGGFAIALRQRF